jgi:prolyl oligopeptidase
MERLDPATLSWIRREGAYSRSVLDAIPRRAALERRMEAFEAQFPAFDSYQSAGGRSFFRERAAGADDFDLMVTDSAGTRKLVDISAIRAADGGTPYAINYFLASPDGSKVAVGISRAGTEAAALRVYDSATGAHIGGSVDRAQFGLMSWSDDSSTLFFNRLKSLAAGETALDRYTGSTVDAWDMRSPPRTVLDHGPLQAAGLPPSETPQFVLSPTSATAALRLQNGADPNIAIWIAAKPRMTSEDSWVPLVSHRDDVTAFALSGSKTYLLSKADAPTFKVLELGAGEPLSAARTVLPADPDRTIDSIQAASDGLYVVARRGLYATLLRIALDGSVEDIPLPGRGTVDEAFTDAGRPGVTLTYESWNQPPRVYAYDPKTRHFADLRLTPKPPSSVARIRVQDLEARGADGVEAPLTVLTGDSSQSPGPMILRAYGSYGISMLPTFHFQMAAFLREGGSYAICHVRGGGELGEAWRLGGKDANKPNTWRDLIACGEDLIARGLVTRNQLFIYGGSGGGIAVGRAATERPDLFAGVIDGVPPANMVRLEFMPDGALETQEFGSIKTEAGFRNLLAMDTYQHVADGVRYPPFLISMGLNDARIAPWQPAKLAARLLAVGDAPVLLRVDLENGHGIGSTRSQIDELYADYFSFVFWISGRPGWRPDASKVN